MRTEWIEHFKLNEEQLVQWYKTLPQSHSLLYWALKTAKIDLHEYLKWAMVKYEIPVLKSSFFAQELSPNFWAKYKNLHPWTPEFLPVHEWQGLLYIACLEPLPMTTTMRTRFVLASTDDMEKWWGELNKPLTKSREISVIKSAAPPPPPPKVSTAEAALWPNASPTRIISQIDGVLLSYFKEIKKYYEYGMLLKVEDSLLYPWGWDDHWSPSAQHKDDGYNLKVPSIFRIVQTTLQPYHGYVVANEINDLFFKNWLEGKTPKHVTIIPIKINGEVIAQFLAASDSKLDLFSSLSFLQEIGEKLSQDLAKFVQGKVAA